MKRERAWSRDIFADGTLKLPTVMSDWPAWDDDSHDIVCG